jgi:hypothetical protein
MATSAKAHAKAATGASAKAATKPGPVAASPSMRFHYSQALKDKTDAVLSAIEQETWHEKQGEVLADLVAELIEAGMDFYFLQTLKLAEAGFVAEQSAKLGLVGAAKLLSSITRKYIERMNHTQLLVVAKRIRSLASPD